MEQFFFIIKDHKLINYYTKTNNFPINLKEKKCINLIILLTDTCKMFYLRLIMSQ